MPDWVKGGIWAVGIYIIITLILFPFGKTCVSNKEYFCIEKWYEPTFYASIPLAIFFYTLIGWEFPGMLYYLFAIVTCFIIGALIGGTIGKIKK